MKVLDLTSMLLQKAIHDCCLGLQRSLFRAFNSEWWSFAFGPNVRNQNFYRVSGAYRISEDMAIPGIQEWKLRGSYGTSGLRPPFQAQYETYTMNEGSATKSTIGNNDLGPFFSKEIEIGTNLSFLDRFNFELNYAEKNTEGQVLQVDIPVELGGFASQWQNAGTLQSKQLRHLWVWLNLYRWHQLGFKCIVQYYGPTN